MHPVDTRGRRTPVTTTTGDGRTDGRRRSGVWIELEIPFSVVKRNARTRSEDGSERATATARRL